MFGSDGHYTGRAHGWVTGNRRTRYFRTNFFASFREEVMRGMNGFTLIELLVTLAILVIAVTVAMPSYSALVQRQRSEEHTSELQSRENLVCRLLLEKKNMALTRHWQRT